MFYISIKIDNFWLVVGFLSVGILMLGVFYKLNCEFVEVVVRVVLVDLLGRILNIMLFFIFVKFVCDIEEKILVFMKVFVIGKVK